MKLYTPKKISCEMPCFGCESVVLAKEQNFTIIRQGFTSKWLRFTRNAGEYNKAITLIWQGILSLAHSP